MMLFSIITFTVSLICYITRPEGYSYSFICFLFALFCVQLVYFLRRNTYDRFINFHSIFLLTNLIVVYLYPIFIHPLDVNFLRNVNENYINLGTSIAQLSLSAYMLGASFIKKKGTSGFNYKIERPMPKMLLTLLYVNIIAIIIYYVPSIGKVYGGLDKNDTLSSLILLFFTITLLWNTSWNAHKIHNIRSFVMNNKKIIFPIMAYCAVLLLVGIRFAVLSILLVLMVTYITYVKNVNYKFLIIGGVSVPLLFFIVAITRNGGDMDSFSSDRNQSVPMIFYVFSDLIGTTNNLYAGAEYVDRNGIMYGSSIIPQIFAPFPFLPTIVTQALYNTDPVTQTTQYLLSDFLGTITTNNVSFVGTNCIIDIYMNMGLIFTILSFVLFGFFTQKLTVSRNKNIYYQCLYFLLVSDAIFMVRGTIYGLYRQFIWAIFLIYLFRHLQTKV
ncbi:MAG: hypothetical protein PWP16_743 [Eubacteriaceae bacterium]|nr:hypothetical protein [Eubacteriaceae bacterium]